MLLTASALLAISFTKSFVVLLLLAIPLGLGGGAIDAALNNYVALHYKASHMSFLHSFWGVGATISPLIMSQFLKQNGNWQGGYRFVSIIQLSLALIMFLTLPLWGKVSHASPDELLGGPIEIDNRVAIKKARRDLRRAFILLLLCGGGERGPLGCDVFCLRARG